MHITIPVDFKILLNKIFTQAFKTPRSYFSTILYTREYIRITALGKDEGLSVSGMTSLNKLNMSVQWGEVSNKKTLSSSPRGEAGRGKVLANCELRQDLKNA